MRVMDSITEPILSPIRRMMPATGGIDFSPIIAIIALNLWARELLIWYLRFLSERFICIDLIYSTFKLLYPADTAMNRIAVDLGGTKTEIMITKENPLEVISKKRIPTEKQKGYDHIVNNIKILVEEMRALADAPNDIKIGLGMPGSPHPQSGIIRNANTTVLNGRFFGKDLEKAVGQKVYIGNDANCLTISEALYGSAKGYNTVCGIIMGTGMGGGVFQNKKIVTGANGNGGEWGHATLEPMGPNCWCGRKGCIELYLSGTGIEQMYFNISGKKAKAKQIYDNYIAGEAEASRTMDVFLDYFALTYNNIYHMFRPDAIVFGGGVSNLPILYTEGYERFLKLSGASREQVKFLKNKLGDSSEKPDRSDMLLFHGIKYEFGTPKRYNTRYDLTASLKTALRFLDDAAGNVAQTLNKIDESVIRPQKSDTAHLTHIRTQNAVLLRAKDIVTFIGQFENVPCVLPVLRTLAGEGTPDLKWLKIKAEIYARFSTQTHAPGVFLFGEGSPFITILRAVRLFLLDLIPERPPANIILKFIPGQFPEHIWSSTDNISERERNEWLPENPLGTADFLTGDLIDYIYINITRTSHASVFTKSVNNSPKYLQAGEKPLPDAVFVSFQEPDEEETEPLPLHDTLYETLLRFQCAIAQRHKSSGLRYLAALLYIFYEHPYDSVCTVNTADEVEKLCGRGILSGDSAERTIFRQVLDAFLDIQITRVYQRNGSEFARRNFLVTPLADTGSLKRDRTELDDNCATEYLKDILLVRTSDNMKPPGYAFRFVPEALFRIPKPTPYFFEIIAFLANIWYDTYEQHDSRVTLSLEDLMRQSGLLIPKRARSTAAESVKKTLAFLHEKRYISHLSSYTSANSQLLWEIYPGEEFLAAAKLDTHTRKQHLLSH
ncbi:hypothetical protein CHS0354_035303 [Potamilus streckersoni]|uniref:ROK family protein n=1 Tax=Potamilus streckersoni TaxID=2493646 RepID=A0AAE0VPC0_9BIVA|nr:hypothetical protein CHS0354_035303 [Potamilus streckersoni]